MRKRLYEQLYPQKVKARLRVFMNLDIVKAEPVYISGAFFSQASNLSRAMNRVQLQEVCFLSTIASFIRKQGATCYASPETLLDAYNKHSHKFGLRQIKRSTLFTIQKRVLGAGLIINELQHDFEKGRNWRKFSLNIDLIAILFSAVIKQAYHRARALLSRKIDCKPSQSNGGDEASEGKGLAHPVEVKTWTRVTKGSKDLKYKNKTPNGAFFKKRFGTDCDLAYQLQEQARNGAISAGGAKMLITLHHKHNVHLAPAFKAFLTYRMLNFSKVTKESSRSASQSSKQRLQAIIETRQGDQTAIEPELLALIENRPEPSRTQRVKSRIAGILERRGVSVEPLQSQSSHLVDTKALSVGVALRKRIQQKINQ